MTVLQSVGAEVSVSNIGADFRRRKSAPTFGAESRRPLSALDRRRKSAPTVGTGSASFFLHWCNSPAMFRSYLPYAEELADPHRVTGTVVIKTRHARHAYYIKDDKNNHLYYFCNIIHHNPFRGLGSTEWCYLLGVDDPEKKKPYMMLMNMPSNAFNFDGPVLEEGQKVTFVPKRPEELVCNEMGDIVLYIIKEGPNCHAHTTLKRESMEAGVACDIALDARVKQRANWFAPWL